jgi:hypothetical protein
MGLFKKEAKIKKEKKRDEIPRLPELPKLPELPNFSGIGERLEEEIPQLPSFPNGSLGNKFSQDTIKEAVAGKKGVEDIGADEFAEEEEMQMMRRPLVRESSRMEREYPKYERQTASNNEEPLFVRIDKFEESSQMLEEVKKKILEVEKMFKDIKKIKEEEDAELGFWEDEIAKIKEKIEKVDKNIFSKLD